MFFLGRRGRHRQRLKVGGEPGVVGERGDLLEVARAPAYRRRRNAQEHPGVLVPAPRPQRAARGSVSAQIPVLVVESATNLKELF